MEHLLRVEGLKTTFVGEDGAREVVDGLSYWIDPGETVCLVGESGCGKSVSSLSLLRLLDKNGYVTGGEVWFEGQELLGLPEKELDRVRGGGIGMVFQDALASLNPVFTVGSQLTESLRAHRGLHRAEALLHAEGLLERVGLPDPAAVLRKYPHTLSGGQRQRVMIAMALSCRPRLLIADEPTTALDVTIQAQIMALLKELQAENGMALLLITHDIGLVAQMADRVLVMYAGQIVERAPVAALFAKPLHPYTRALLNSVPSVRDEPGRRLESIPGAVPERYDTIAGCRFAARCPRRGAGCEAAQPLFETGEGRAVRCCRWREEGEGA